MGVELIPNIPSASKRRSIKMDMERKMNLDYKILFYELLTNIPENVTKIVYKLVKTNDGLDCELHQYQPKLHSHKEFQENITDEHTAIGDIKPRGAGGMFGIGTQNIDDYSVNLRMSFKQENGLWLTTTFGENPQWIEESLSVPDGVTVVHRFGIDNSSSTIEQMIGEWKILIGRTECKQIEKGMEHIFEVSNFGESLDKQLSGLVPPLKTIWETRLNSIPTPKYDSLFTKSGTITKSICIQKVMDFDNNQTQLDVSITGLGKRSEKNDFYFELGEIKDQPFMALYMEEGRQQFAGFVPIRKLTGKWHLNYVMVEGYVKKDDIKRFYSSPDKFKPFKQHFQDTVMATLQRYVEHTYKDDTIEEESLQGFLYGILKEDRFGENFDEYTAKTVISKLFPQLEVLWNLPKGYDRTKLVSMEWSEGRKRLDIKVRLPKKVTGKDVDTLVCIEVKKKNFTPTDTEQCRGYISSIKGLTAIYGFSQDIKPDSYDVYDGMIREVNDSNQIKWDNIEGGLLDVLKSENGLRLHWENNMDYYTNEVEQRREKNKKK